MPRILSIRDFPEWCEVGVKGPKFSFFFSCCWKRWEKGNGYPVSWTCLFEGCHYDNVVHWYVSWTDLEEFRTYLEKRFDFEQVTVKKFRTWAERRQFNREMKRKQAESERPILPANQKLITLSVQDAPTKKGELCLDYQRHQMGHVIAILTWFIFSMSCTYPKAVCFL